MSSEEDILQLWGKSDDDDETNWHPLLFHMLDIGNVTRLLWDEFLPRGTKWRIASGIGLPYDEAGIETARRVVILLAAQHDLGKASSFQTKVPRLWTGVQNALGLSLPDSCPTPPHGFVTTKLLPSLIANGAGGWSATDSDVAKMLARITGGHHGKFPAGADIDPTQISPAALGDSQWDVVRVELLRLTESCLFPETAPDTPPMSVPAARLRNAALIPLIGGLISVADCIGSSQDYFPPAAKAWPSLRKYADESRDRAARALGGFHWTSRPSFAASAGFEDIFPFRPNPMQRKVVECADAAEEPYLLIVEAAMGEGKTEAALYAIDRALTTGKSHGFYLALPTQATGNAMFDRVLAFLESRTHGGSGDRLNFQLAHGGSFLSDRFEKLKLAAIYGDGGKSDSDKNDDGATGRVVAEGWFTYRKRPLLAPFGVGTIDQSLVGILQTKHWFVRLFGLAGKVVVFDEVHAYDIYMSQLLCRLLGWLRILGCTVILLSATLPEKKRRELAAAWNPKAPPPDETAYPRVTMVGSEEKDAKAEAWPVSQTNLPKTVEVAYAGLEFAALAETLTTDLPDGVCAALICNTVGRAQEAYETLTAALVPKGWKVMLFHARTIANWRQETEAAVLGKFGKEANGVTRPEKTILIGTQVMEQSLDLDFDWMASEIAPVDLLLQRMGRLWRHTNRTNRVKSATKPLFYILCGDKTAGEPPEVPPYTDWVYEKYILLRTRLALEGKSLTLPDSIEPLIKAVYDDSEPGDLSAAWQTLLAECLTKMEGKREKEEGLAKIVMVASSDNSVRTVLSPGANAGTVEHEVYDDDDPRVHPDARAATRLGDPSISVICFGTDDEGKPLAEAVRETSEPTKGDARKLLGFGISISNRGLFNALKDADPPKAWKESPYLRFHRTLHFENGVTPKPVGGYILRLSRAEGLRIEREDRIDD